MLPGTGPGGHPCHGMTPLHKYCHCFCDTTDFVSALRFNRTRWWRHSCCLYSWQCVATPCFIAWCIIPKQQQQQQQVHFESGPIRDSKLHRLTGNSNKCRTASFHDCGKRYMIDIFECYIRNRQSKPCFGGCDVNFFQMLTSILTQVQKKNARCPAR